MAQRLTTYRFLYEQLESAQSYDASVVKQTRSGDAIRPNKAGQAIANMYEQLRNATELADGSITLQRAIKRFYKRTLIITHYTPDKVGRELLAELILGGYIEDGSVGENAAQMITDMVIANADLYRRLRDSKVPQKQARNWTLAILSVRTYDLLLPHTRDLVMAGFTYQYFYDELPQNSFVEDDSERATFSDALYVATLQALLQSNIDVVRTALLHTHDQDGYRSSRIHTLEQLH